MPRVVVCLGDPIIDLVAKVDQTVLAALGLVEGGSVAISSAESRKLLQTVNSEASIKRSAGGSAANVAKALAALFNAAGAVGFAGRIGDDTAGREFKEQILNANIGGLLCCGKAEETATCICLVTPSGQRTMRACLAAAAGMKDIAQLPSGWLHNCKLLHCEGYVLYRPQLAVQAMSLAKKEDALVSLDLASFELIGHSKATLFSILEDKLVDIVICNEEEAAALAEILPESSRYAGRSSIQDAQAFLLQHCQISIVSLGAKGCLLQEKGEAVLHCNASSVPIKDTIGAGDNFTAGFLYAFLQGNTLQKCGDIACCIGTASVQHEGATMDEAAWRHTRASVKSILAGYLELL